jgi:hypothetical protein
MKEGILGILAIFVIIGVFTYQPPKINKNKKQPFTVVSKYNGCDVVRYESGQYPQFVYLLDCKK